MLGPCSRGQGRQSAGTLQPRSGKAECWDLAVEVREGRVLGPCSRGQGRQSAGTLQSRSGKAECWDLAVEVREGRVLGPCSRGQGRQSAGTLQPRSGKAECWDLAAEVREGRVLGPMEPGYHPRVHVNQFGLVPKSHQPGKWRLIVDLSHPRGASVNGGVEPGLCSMNYTSVAVAVKRVLALGEGARLAKFDVEGAYRTVPVHPDDRWLLGMRWRDKLYLDKVLPLGLRSAPNIYTAVADGLQWILRQEGMDFIHYLDDFLLVGAPGTDQCEVGLRSSQEWCRRLSSPQDGRSSD